ncbi:MAG: outer membrane beta-barrel protein [Emcibacteraceae bacterium]|nr:outer membrane beta-barrel protein [Emcibacteraceae bacterium]MDG1858840.1 outer membrane beta-barrel protein [Emcibacteraceae bacterium]
MKKSHKITALLMTTVFSFHQLTHAQKVETTDDGSIVTYEQDYFEKYSAVTLLDMLLIIPGAKEIVDKNKNQRQGGGADSQGERGFGSGGDQILIGGKRLAGKTNSIDDNLSRISAEAVEKIEIIRGATSGLDVQSQGLVINVTLKEGGTNATTFWKVSGKKTLEKDFKPEFTLSRSGTLNNIDYSFSAERSENGYFYNRDEEAYNGSDIKTSDQNVLAGFSWASYKFNGGLGIAFQDGGQLSLNGLFEPGTSGGYEIRKKSTNALNPVTRDVDGSSDKWEIGGDYTRNLGSLGRFKALFVLNRETNSEDVINSTGNGTSLFEHSNEAEEGSKSEKILRVGITKNLNEKHSLELGGEVAINTFDKAFQSRERDAASDPLLLINSDDVIIKENRYEVFANHTFNISPAIVLQSSLTTEFSKIVADNVFAGGSPTRRDTSFTYLKPRINLRYDITDRNQFRATVEKKVSQLDFGNFVTRYDQQVEVLRLGNTNIRPEQIWDFSAEFEHRLPNDGGTIGLEVFYRDYKDHITEVDFTEYQDFGGNSIDANSFFALPPTGALRDMIDFTSKSGNIDEASAIGAKVNVSKRLDFIGLPDAVLSANYVYEKRRATDQFTGENRNFNWSSDHTVNFNFRHDLTDFGLAYGFSGQIRSDYTLRDMSYIWPTKPSAEFEIFAEYNVFNGIKLAVEIENMTGKHSTSTFTFYNDHIKFDESWGRSERKTTNWMEISVSLQGTF